MPLPVRRACGAELYRTGDVRERQALLKWLAFLPDPERFVAAAVDAVRSSALPVLEAIACDNPYPAAFFAAAAFNQMVLADSRTRTAGARRRAPAPDVRSRSPAVLVRT